MGETLKRKYGPLPVWAWALILVVLLAAYLAYRKKQAAAAAAAAQQAAQNNLSSNLGTVPVSNLTTAAQPMPIQLGDTFVNTTVGGPSPNPNPTWKKPPSLRMKPGGLPALLLKIGQAENAATLNAFGGNAGAALTAEGLTPSQIQGLNQSVAAGGGNFLTENMVAKQAGLPYYNAQGELVSANGTSYNGTPL